MTDADRTTQITPYVDRAVAHLANVAVALDIAHSALQELYAAQPAQRRHPLPGQATVLAGQFHAAALRLQHVVEDLRGLLHTGIPRDWTLSHAGAEDPHTALLLARQSLADAIAHLSYACTGIDTAHTHLAQVSIAADVPIDPEGSPQ